MTAAPRGFGATLRLGEITFHQSGAPPPPPPAPPQAAGAAEPDDMNEYGALLSPSQVDTWTGCQAKWYFRYFRQLPDRPTGSLAFGTAIHQTLARNFEVKAHVGRDLKTADAIELFTSTWRAQAEGAMFRANQDPDQYEHQGRQLVALYLERVAPGIHPAVIDNQPAVEMEVTGAIGGVPARGFIDLIDGEGRIIDLKSSSRSSKEIKPHHRAQLAAYRLIGPEMLTGECRVDQLVRKSQPDVIPLDHRITGQDQRFVEKLYPLSQAGMRNGLYVPNRSSLYCSRSQCSYWRECMEEFGGDVPA